MVIKTGFKTNLLALKIYRLLFPTAQAEKLMRMTLKNHAHQLKILLGMFKNSVPTERRISSKYDFYTNKTLQSFFLIIFCGMRRILITQANSCLFFPESLLHPCNRFSGRREKFLHPCNRLSGTSESLSHPCKRFSGTSEKSFHPCKKLSGQLKDLDIMQKSLVKVQSFDKAF
ncbi:Uncharacterised protein [Chryseobacterium taihuense]|uniref:Uncharacterized protein n=1 Tax=Chryseobacterium taihuense TaxID=1141221 RepID=A0A4U8WM85_9FLAO|nr:Uncharacterised protein [Chryseobacterium taihuense]